MRQESVEELHVKRRLDEAAGGVPEALAFTRVVSLTVRRGDRDDDGVDHGHEKGFGHERSLVMRPGVKTLVRRELLADLLQRDVDDDNHETRHCGEQGERAVVRFRVFTERRRSELLIQRALPDVVPISLEYLLDERADRHRDAEGEPRVQREHEPPHTPDGDVLPVYVVGFGSQREPQSLAAEPRRTETAARRVLKKHLDEVTALVRQHVPGVLLVVHGDERLTVVHRW